MVLEGQESGTSAILIFVFCLSVLKYSDCTLMPAYPSLVAADTVM
jgi:hypothetical protein